MGLDIVKGAKQLANNLAAFVTAGQSSAKSAIKKFHGYEIKEFTLFDYDADDNEYYGSWNEQGVPMVFRISLDEGKLWVNTSSDDYEMPAPTTPPTLGSRAKKQP